jgi:hypothetical protein
MLRGALVGHEIVGSILSGDAAVELDFSKFLKGFSAPLGFESQRLEFLPGFIDRSTIITKKTCQQNCLNQIRFRRIPLGLNAGLKVEFASISIALNLPKRQVKITPKKKMEINPARKDCFSTLPFQNGNHHH